MTAFEAWIGSLWTASWQGLIFVALVWLVCLAVKKLPASTRAWLWWLASLRLVLGLMWAGIALPLLPAREVSPLAQLNGRMDLMAPNLGPYAHIQTAWTDKAGTAASGASPTGNFWPVALFALWAVGVFIATGVMVVQGLRVRRLRARATPADESRAGEIARGLGAKMGLSKRPQLYFSEEITAPMVAGALSPVVLLPHDLEQTLDEEELRLCLGHELAHIRRHDLPLALVPTVMQAVYFFFPPAWLIRREWETERETACDQEALAATTASPAAYGHLLLKIITADHRGGLAPALGATASYHTLRKRIASMKHFVPAPRRLKLAATLIACSALLLAVPWQLTARASSVPILAEKNDILNGGFEEEMSNWQQDALPPGASTSVAVSIDTEVHHSGKASLKFSKTESSFFPVSLVKQEVPTGQGRYIKVSLWAKADSVHKFVAAVGTNRSFAIYIGEKSSPGGSVSHDWQQYTSTVKVDNPQVMTVSLEMYGPGTIWVDDVAATYTDSSSMAPAEEATPEDIKDVSNEDLTVGGDPMMRYFLIGAKGPEPADGRKLIILMPGGEGNAAFNPFVRRIWKNALPPGYMIAELVAPKWSDEQFNSVVWPTRKQRWAEMKFATEDFIEKVITAIGRKHKIDAAHVYTLSWSSGGPAAYAASLAIPAIKGSFVAMSVFHPTELPGLFNAKGHAYYIYHSPDDKLIAMSQPQLADAELKKAGAKTTLVTYEGGHGWHGDMFSDIRKGIEWLEQNGG